MDSEHRHELEENDLAKWLKPKVEQFKEQAPAYVVGLVAVLAGLFALSGWRASNANAQADRWQDFAVALEQTSRDLDELKRTAEEHPGTPAGEWAEVTWADGRLYQATSQYFRDRETADTAADEAAAVYEKLLRAKDDTVAERAGYQLARVLELQGKLDEAREQYGRVTGAFAEVAQARAEELDSDRVKNAYEWITATRTASASASAPAVEGLDDLKPDDIEMPEVTAADAEATLDDLLGDVEAEEAAEAETETPGEEAEAPADE